MAGKKLMEDGILTSDMVPIERSFPGREDIVVYPVFDLHLGAAECMEAEWALFRKRVLEQENAYVVIGGDMLNNGIKSSVTNVYAETMRPREQKKVLTEHLGPLRDRIICMTGGNHERRTAREADQNPLYDVACKLDLEDLYRESGCFVVLRFGRKEADGLKNPTYRIAVFHGAGGGMYIGSGANRGERFGAVIDGLDALITGHTHKPMTFPVCKLVFDAANRRVTQKQFRVVVATSWLNYGDYAMQKMMVPTAHCISALHLKGDRKGMRVEM